jgi:hypothetical protein
MIFNACEFIDKFGYSEVSNYEQTFILHDDIVH